MWNLNQNKLVISSLTLQYVENLLKDLSHIYEDLRIYESILTDKYIHNTRLSLLILEIVVEYQKSQS